MRVILTQQASLKRRRRASSVTQFSAVKNAHRLSDHYILQALSYDIANHAPESLDWLNVLVAQVGYLIFS